MPAMNSAPRTGTSIRVIRPAENHRIPLRRQLQKAQEASETHHRLSISKVPVGLGLREVEGT